MPKNESDLFYELHSSLLQYVNRRLKIFPNIKTPKELKNAGVKNVHQVWLELWKNPKFITDFILENPDRIPEEKLAIVANWKHFIKDKFYIFRHLKKYTIFLSENQPTKAYGVHSLITPLDEMFWDENLPIYTEAVLIPFLGYIIYDGILYPYSVTFGPGIRFSLKEDYRKAKDTFGIIATLENTH